MWQRLLVPVLIHLLILFVNYPSVLQCYRAKKVSPQTLNRIKRLINQRIQVENEKFGSLLQSDAVGFERRDPNSQPHLDELSVNDPDQYFQGDVDLSEKQAQILNDELETESVEKEQNKDSTGIRRKRKIGREPLYVRWNRNQPISYDFEKSIPYATREKIKGAIQLWEQNTCIRFRESGPNVDRIEFFDGGGCSSFVGKTGGTQGVSISTPGCDNVGIISHEIGHALGIFHEQARPDQSSNIYVNYQNIPISRWNNFQPFSPTQADTFSLPYDAGSVMHYGPYGFATDPYIATIVTRDKSLQSTIGQREGPSFLDFEAINRAYRCNDHCPPLACTHGGYANPNNCFQCICPVGFTGRLCELLQYSPCGELIEVSRKPITISSPNYPNDFSQNTECIWLLKAPLGGKVFLEFTEQFELSCEDTCDRAYVELKASSDFRLTGYRFCCSKIPQKVFESKTNEMVVIFRAKQYTSKGFKAKIWSDKLAPKEVIPEIPVIPVPEVTSYLVTTTPTATKAISTKFAILPKPGFTSTITPATSLRTARPSWVISPVPVTPRTLATTTRLFWLTSSSVAPPTQPEKLSDCKCLEWSEWTSSCTQLCGGCGKRVRKRWCNAKDCRTEDKRACNFQACPPGTNFLINNGEFHILWKGCCVGLFRSGLECTSLEDEENPFLTIITALLSPQDEKRNRNAAQHRTRRLA